MGRIVALLGCLLTATGARGEVGPARLTAWMEGIAESAQATADGDAARAEIAARQALAARPSGPTAARAELALGLALRDQERFAEASAALARARAGLVEGPLADLAAFEHAQALFYAGEPGAAAALFAQVGASPAGELARRARWREADALLEAGTVGRAVEAYRGLLARDAGASAAPGARLALASALRRGGDQAGAVATYRALWMELPADPAGRAAGRALRAWSAAGGDVPPPSPEQRLERATRLLELSLPRRVLAAIDQLEAARPPPEPATRGRLLRALALLQLRRLDEARAAALRIEADPAAAPGTRAGAELVLARVAARAGRTDEAARRYRALARRREAIPGLGPAQSRDLPDEAAFLAAWLYYDAGAYRQAAEKLRAFARAHPGARRAEDARWFEAWSLHRAGRRADALRALARLGGPLLPAALYWRGRLAATAEEALPLYRRVLREAPPGTWYALLAASRLQAAGEAAPGLGAGPPTPIPDGTPAGDGAGPLARAAALLGVGARDDALAELRALAGSRAVASSAAAVAQLGAAAGDAEIPFRMARDHLPLTRRTARWLYPDAFPALLRPASAAAPVDPWLYLAVMRRESAFRADARSMAGAVGPVQLIPPTAERLATVLGVPAREVRRLDVPAVSIPLGAAYLALLGERFRDPAVVLAGYNAGPAAAARWAADGAGLPLDAWVEDVAYRETRRYVRNVSADQAVYRTLWEGAPLAIDGTRRIPAPREGVGF